MAFNYEKKFSKVSDISSEILYSVRECFSSSPKVASVNGIFKPMSHIFLEWIIPFPNPPFLKAKTCEKAKLFDRPSRHQARQVARAFLVFYRPKTASVCWARPCKRLRSLNSDLHRTKLHCAIALDGLYSCFSRMQIQSCGDLHWLDSPACTALTLPESINCKWQRHFILNFTKMASIACILHGL